MERWGASLPQQPVPVGKGRRNTVEPKPPQKPPPAVTGVQSDLVAHLQRAFPILDSSITSLIIEENSENLSEAVKILSSLAADAEKEAASSSGLAASSHAAPCSSIGEDDKVAMEMAIAASLADQKMPHLGGGATSPFEAVSEQDSQCLGDQNSWESTDPAVAAEWGAPLPGQSDVTGLGWLGSPADNWQDVPGESSPERMDLPVVSEAALALADNWGTELQGALDPVSGGMLQSRGPGVEAMAAILGENWAKESLWGVSGEGGLVENRDPAVGRPKPKVQGKGKSKVRPYSPRIAVEQGKQEGKRPYSPKVFGDRKDPSKDGGVARQLRDESPSTRKVVETPEGKNRNLPEDNEAQVLKQLKAMFPEVANDVICRVYVDSDSDANRAAEALFQEVEENPSRNSSLVLEDSEAPKQAAASQERGALNEVPKSAAISNIVHSRQHPNPFSEDDSDMDPPVVSQSLLTSPETTKSSSTGTSPQSSAVVSPASSPRSQKKGRRGRRGKEATSSSGDEEARSTRTDMVDFMVSMLGGSVPVAVVADVIENLKGDFQQSLKCLLSMSAGSEGGLIEEEFGAMTDGSQGVGNGSESRPSSDGEEEDPVATLVNIFGADKIETIQQVLKEKGGNVGDAATVLMAMFESETGVSSGDDFMGTVPVEEQPVSEEDDSDDHTVKINLEQLMAHFPLADKSAVRSLLRINNNSFEDTAKMLYDSGLLPRGLDVASLSDHRLSGPAHSRHSQFSHHQPSQNVSLVPGSRSRPPTPPYGRGSGPLAGYDGVPSFNPSFQQPPAHLQPLFRAEEFPEIGTDMPAFPEAPEGRAVVDEGHNALFLKNRSATNKHWRACQYYFSEAARARANREFSRAEALKEQGRKHKRLAEAANQVASSKIFSEKNKTIRNTIKIDVHGQLVQEALAHVDDHLKNLANLTTISYLSIITGRGLHSENGKAKILPAVQKYLRDRGYTFYQENPGCVVVDLKAERQVPSSLSSAEDADDRPSSAESYEERPGRVEGAGNGQATYRKLNLA